MKKVFIPFLILLITSISCTTTVDTFEKNIPIPEHEWKSDFKPQFNFEVRDTVSKYNLYIVVRHTDAYRYNNIWVNLYSQIPGDSAKKQRFDLRLATDDKGWLGSGMDDIYEHRVLIAPVKFPRAGTYHFGIEQLMREDPLEYITDVGIRVEKNL